MNRPSGSSPAAWPLAGSAQSSPIGITHDFLELLGLDAVLGNRKYRNVTGTSRSPISAMFWGAISLLFLSGMIVKPHRQ
jgi:hypothetical protein